MNKLIERFIKYVKINTQSAYNTGITPSTSGQMEFARMLAEELRSIGLKNVDLDKNGYVMAELPANINKKVPTVGFIAHVDTAAEFSGKNVNPQIVESYDGSDIILNEKENIVLSPNDFPEIKNYVGQTIITTDGTTLLGADDKAGVAEIITALEYLINNPEIPHGKVRVCFTPDEEIGAGADYFDIKKFDADFAYTIDGGEIGELNYENFNAAYAKITIKGRDAHPGEAKNKMINSMLIANELISSLPNNEIPQETEGYEGFFHLMSVEGNVGKTTLQYIIRDFDAENQEKRKHLIRENCKKMAERYGQKNVELEMRDQYYNMRKKLEPVKHVVEIARKAMEDVGVTPKIIPVRGGTDGSRLSFKGLPTPNIFGGGHNFHGRFEYIPAKSMEKAVEVIIKIVENIAK